MGFPLHQGTVESGLVTCHWHNARFDLSSGCTLDPFADDARGFDVTIDGDDVLVAARDMGDPVPHLRRRLEQGLEDGLTLVIAKSVLGLLEAGVQPADIVRVGLDFGTRYRRGGWGAGLTVLVAMANLLPHLDDGRPRARAHARARLRVARHEQSTAAVRPRSARRRRRSRPSRRVVPPLHRDPVVRRRRTFARHRDRVGQHRRRRRR